MTARRLLWIVVPMLLLMVLAGGGALAWLLLHSPAQPARLVVLGGGPIGCELAQSFARLGSAVTQVEMAPRIMLREDEDVSEFARNALEADGVQVLTGHKALRCLKTGDTSAPG